MEEDVAVQGEAVQDEDAFAPRQQGYRWEGSACMHSWVVEVVETPEHDADQV
jgi:hypothetical protein